MQQVAQYLKKNKGTVIGLFQSLSQDGEVPATKLFSFLQEVFRIEPIGFWIDGKSYYEDDENQAHTERVIEQYYKTTPDGKSSKFYLYRISFTIEEIQEYLQYWISTDKTLQVHYPNYVEPNNNNSGEGQGQSQSPQQAQPQNVMGQNEFLSEEHHAPMLQEQYQKQMEELEQQLLKVAPNTEQAKEVQQKIEEYRNKIQSVKAIQVSSKINLSPKSQSQEKTTPKSHKKALTERVKPREVNFKALFDFYAKQNHFTGAKVSFERIQHESQTINYQKLVHFLKQYELFPEKTSTQKRLHGLYVRTACDTRDLRYQDFMKFLQKLPQIAITIPPGSTQTKKEIMMNKIISKSEKNKLLMYPFHSQQKADFRINPQIIKYSFKVKPMKGKLEGDVNQDLELRKQRKEQAKADYSKQKDQRLLRKLKKLMAIDPYHPLILKNQRFLRKAEKSEEIQPVANLDNMEKFRDASFDVKAKFGIADLDEDPLRQVPKRYQVATRIDLIEKKEEQRISALMSGLAERSDAKIQKFSISPKKRETSSRLA